MTDESDLPAISAHQDPVEAPGAVNPYAPIGSGKLDSVPSDPNILAQVPGKPQNPWKTLAKWTAVCVFAAAPSFLLGLDVTNGEILGMLVGIAVFIAIYTYLDLVTYALPIRRKPRIRLTLKITYGVRIAMTILFPIGLYVDVICGILSVELAQVLTRSSFGIRDDSATFFEALVTTLIQGCVLNVVLAVFAVGILSIWQFASWLTKKTPL